MYHFTISGLSREVEWTKVWDNQGSTVLTPFYTLFQDRLSDYQWSSELVDIHSVQQTYIFTGKVPLLCGTLYIVLTCSWLRGWP